MVLFRQELKQLNLKITSEIQRLPRRVQAEDKYKEREETGKEAWEFKQY